MAREDAAGRAVSASLRAARANRGGRWTWVSTRGAIGTGPPPMGETRAREGLGGRPGGEVIASTLKGPGTVATSRLGARTANGARVTSVVERAKPAPVLASSGRAGVPDPRRRPGVRDPSAREGARGPLTPRSCRPIGGDRAGRDRRRRGRGPSTRWSRWSRVHHREATREASSIGALPFPLRSLTVAPARTAAVGSPPTKRKVSARCRVMETREGSRAGRAGSR